MTTTYSKKEKRNRTKSGAKPELPWNVILHSDWDNSMPRVVVILKKVISGMTYKRAAGIMYEAHRNGRAVAKSSHRELAELYEERLPGRRPNAVTEPA